MYKKVLIIILVFSPLWYSLLVGYPIISSKDFQTKEKARPNITISRRCFAVGDFKEFEGCFKNSERIKGINFVSQTTGELNQISNLFGVLFLIGLITFIVASTVFILM